MSELEAVNARSQEAYARLKEAVDEYFSIQSLRHALEHDAECDEPDCPSRALRAESSPESLSSFVVLAELTAIAENGQTITHTSQTYLGSAMCVLGLLTEAQAKFVQAGG